MSDNDPVERLSRLPLVAEHIGPADAPYYVYLLVDPRTKAVFYVGKGTGERFRSHGTDDLKSATLDSPEDRGPKLARIRAIRNAGKEPRVEFLRSRIATEAEAYRLEAAVIDVLIRTGAPLTNLVRGQGSELGLVTLEDLERRLAAPDLTTNTPAILIRLGPWINEPDDETHRPGYGYRSGMSDAELLDSTRAWWPFDRSRVGRYAYAVAVYDGVTRGIWTIDQTSWRPWKAPHGGGRTEIRWAFDATTAPPDRREEFVGEIGKRVRVRPSGGPVFGQSGGIAYWPK
jgi:hypothetical protein